MVIAANYPFLEVFWTMVVFFAWVAWFWVAITVLTDVFRRRDLSGWGKAAWTIVVIVLPFLGVLVYLIVHSQGMTERQAQRSQTARAQVDDHVRSVSSGGPAAEIEKAEQLLKTGVIDEPEFNAIKARALTQ